jgi:hypothetical protein
MKYFLAFMIIILFNSCGYKPSISYASSQLEGKVYISVDTNINNAQNSILIKDELVKLVLNTFKLSIANNKKEANSFMSGKLLSATRSELLSDTSGFAKIYREAVEIEITYSKKNAKAKTYKLKNYYDFSIDNDSTITNDKTNEAISIAVSKALVNLFSKIAVDSQK